MVVSCLNREKRVVGIFRIYSTESTKALATDMQAARASCVGLGAVILAHVRKLVSVVAGVGVDVLSVGFAYPSRLV